MLAQMCGRGSPEHIGYALKAYYSTVRLIQIGVENAAQMWKEIQKLNAQADAAVGQDKKATKQAGVSINDAVAKKSNIPDAAGRSKLNQISFIFLNNIFILFWVKFSFKCIETSRWSAQVWRNTVYD